MNDDLFATGRVAVITGAALGIGAAAARRFSALGMRLCLLDRNEDALRDLVGDLGRGADVRTTVGDVTSTDDLNALCASAYDRVHEALEGDAWIAGRAVGEEFAEGRSTSRGRGPRNTRC